MAKRDVAAVKRLREIYYDPAGVGAYGGESRLLNEARRRGIKVTRAAVRTFLTDQHAYSLHKPVRKTFKRNKTCVSGIDKQWQADLADMQGVSADNGGMRFMLTCIDVFSKYAWVIPIKDKTANTMVIAFKRLFTMSAPRKPARLQTDKGSEFLCKPVQTLLQSYNIQHFASDSDQKAAVVERFNRTIKTRIWTYFTAKRTRKYVDILPKFVDAYNRSYHRSIGMAPVEVSVENENRIWRRLYGDGSDNRPQRLLKPKEAVRISRWKGDFEKGYMPNWSAENFHITSVIKHPRAMYELRDTRGEPLRGAFYRQEVQPIRTNKHIVHKVLSRRTHAGVKEAFVQWKGWPAKFNSWIAQNDLTKFS